MIAWCISLRIKPGAYQKEFLTAFLTAVVLHGLECVNWTVKLEQSIDKFHDHMRFITNKRLIDLIKIEDLLKITKLNPAMSIINSKSLKLFGHIKDQSLDILGFA